MSFKPGSQSARLIGALSDRRWHSVPWLHDQAGTMRMNSVAAGLRKRGYLIECKREPGEVGAAAYFYRLIGTPEDRANVVDEFGEDLVRLAEFEQLDLVNALQEGN